MTFQKSDKIKQWFADNSEGDKHDWFWQFVEETEPFDAKEGEGDHIDELLERGFLLGQKAAKAVSPVFTHVYDDVDSDSTYFHDLHLYFIGEEFEVIARLQDRLDRWLAKYPQGTEVEKRQSELKKQIECAEQELLNKQKNLINLQQKLSDFDE